MLELTRLLYARDEVEATLLLTILKKKSIEECLFWTNELVWSGYDIRPVLWSIYYDFYAQHNPSFEKKMLRKLQQFDNGNLNALFVVVKSMRLLKSSDNVFSLRLSKVPDSLTIYRGRTPKWLLAYDKECRPFARAASSLNWKQLILTWHNQSLTPVKMIKTFIGGLCESSLLPKGAELAESIIDERWKKTLSPFMDESHRALATLVCLLTPENEIESNCRMVALNASENEYLEGLRSPIPLTKGGNQRTYDTLIYKRHFKIDKQIGAFKLERFDLDDFRASIVYKWPLYVSSSPFWQEVFRRYQITVDPNGNLDFKDDTDDKRLEAFSNDYGYVFELDDPRQTLAMEQGWAHVDSEHDVVDVMDEIFADAEDLRMEFNELSIDISKKAYEDRRDVFTFDKLKMILDTV